MEKDQVNALIKKYLDNTATAEEIQQLHDWYRSVNEELPVVLPYENAAEEKDAKHLMFENLTRRMQQDEAPRKSANWFYKLAAVAAILVIGAFFTLKFSHIKQLVYPAKQLTASTKFGERKLLQLTDGSKIWLSPGSTLNYPDKFNGATREITFEGEAYFEIAKDKKHPFIVHTDKTATRVLGTSFNIKSFKNKQNVEVALIEGKVAFTDGKAGLTLLPNQKVVYKKAGGSMQKSTFINGADIIARRDGEYKFDDEPVADVVADLERNFDTHIILKGKVGNCTFFGRKNKGESMDKFMNKLALIVNASVTKTANGYVLEGGGCR